MGSTRTRVGQDGTTRYVALYRDLRGRQRSAGTHSSRRRADKAWQRAEALVESGRLGDLRRGRQTFRQYVVETWLPLHQVEATTRERYTYAVGKHLLPEFGSMRMIDILPEHVRSWIAKQKAAGLAHGTIAGNKTILSAIFTTALNDQVVFFHPCAGVKTPTIARKPRVIVTPEQYDAIYAGLPGPTSELLVETAIESGLRWGELTELRPADLDLLTRMLTVSRAVIHTRTPGEGTTIFAVKDYPKDKEYRRLKLSPAVCAAIADHIARHALTRTDLLFPFALVEDDVRRSRGDDLPSQPLEPIVGRTEPNDRGRTYPHGTLTGYTLGRCRCPHCRATFARYRADRRAVGKDEVREWARAHGHTVSDRGRIPVAVLEAYRAAR